jgi:hypothetical protein
LTVFVLEQIINEIHEAYTELTGTQIVAELGNLAKAENADTPRIVWTLTGGQYGPSTKIGGADAAQAQALASFFVWLWFDDLEQCWNAMANMLAAIRRTVYGPNCQLLKFDVPTQVEGRSLDKGEVIVLTVVLSVPMRVDGTMAAQEFEFENHESTVTMESDLTNPVTDDHEVFETVLVTGPLP